MKKQHFYFLLIIIMLSFGLGMGSCRKKQCHDPKNPECENYDAALLKPTANFRMRQSLVPFGFEDKSSNIAEFSDTICASEQGVLFEALEQNARSYEWSIGEDARKFSGKKVYLEFSDFLQDTQNLGVKIPVKLRIVKTPPKGLNYRDSIYEKTRYLVFLPKFLWEGKFEGVFEDNANKITTIEISTTPKIHKYPPGIFADKPKDSVQLESFIFRGLPVRPYIPVSWEYGNDENNCDTYFTSYKQWNWQISQNKIEGLIGIDDLTSGLLGFHAYADISISGQTIIKVIYKFRANKTAPIKTYIFKGEKK